MVSRHCVFSLARRRAVESHGIADMKYSTHASFRGYTTQTIFNRFFFLGVFNLSPMGEKWRDVQVLNRIFVKTGASFLFVNYLIESVFLDNLFTFVSLASPISTEPAA